MNCERMNCARYAEWIARKLEGTLPRDLAHRLDVHLAGCARCRAELALQRRIEHALSQPQPSGLPADFTQKVCRRAFRASASRRRLDRFVDLIPALAFSTATLTVFLLRHELALALPSLLEPLGGVLASPVAGITNAILGFLAWIANLPAEHIPVLERLSRPVLTTLVATLLGIVPLLWALVNVIGFLKE